MTKPLDKHSKDELRSRINKGQALLDAEHKVLFAAWTTSRAAKVGRTVQRFTKTDLIAAYTTLAELYRKQSTVQHNDRFDDATLSLKERTQRRAAAIRERMKIAKDKALATGRAVKVIITE